MTTSIKTCFKCKVEQPIFAGTRRENVQDMMRKGRHRTRKSG